MPRVAELQTLKDSLHTAVCDPTCFQPFDELRAKQALLLQTHLIQKDPDGYNQVKGERLIGLFTNNELDTVNINKNAEVIYFSRNDKEELVGINNTVSSNIQLYLKEQQILLLRCRK